MAISGCKAALGALGCLALGANANAQPSPDEQVPAEQVPAEDLQQIDDFEIDRDRYERMTIPVTIEGQGPYRFLIDTGAQATVVTSKITDDLAILPTGRALLIAMGSSEVVDTIELDGLEFANRKFNGLTAPLLKDRHIGADGILGLDSLQDLRVLIDFREDRIAVADASELGGNSGYEIVVRARRKLGQMIITNARVDGIRTAVVIDTGAVNSHGNATLRRKLRARHKDELFTTDVNGFELRSDLSMAGELKIGGLALSQVPIGFSDSPVFAALELEDQPALILGMHNLQVFDRVAIDFSDRRVLFDLPGSIRTEQFKRRVFYPTRIGTP